MQYNPQNPQYYHGKRRRMGREDIVHLSETLAFLLSHGAEKLGFTFMPGGFLYVDDLLWYHRPLWGFTDEHIQEVVRTNDKQRFALQKDHNGRLMIRANQGHTTADEANGKGKHEANSLLYQRSNPQDMKYNLHEAQNPQHSHGKRRRMGREDIVRLSKTLAFLLRHGAEKSGFTFMPGGFLYVDEVLWYHRPLWGFTDEHIQEVVRTNDKQRFALQKDHNGRLMIRANQGHTTAVQGLDLTPICDTSEVEMVVHGTYYEAWEQIKRTGLSRMNRIHIHFANGMPGESGVISGMRKSCQVVIEINMEMALKAGIPFFRSANNVILSPGNAKGFIPPIFFKRAFDRNTGERLSMDVLRSKSSFGQDTSSPSVQVTGELPGKRKRKDQIEDESPHKKRKDEPKSGSQKARLQTGEEQTKEMTGLRFGQCQENEDGETSGSKKSKYSKGGGTVSKSQNKK